MMRGNVDVDDPGQSVRGLQVGHDGRDPVRRPGEHGLPWRCIHRHRHLRLPGDQVLSGLGIEFDQSHRALARQPGHQLGAGGDDL